jgi:dTDP-4-dehydrorhamnose 3,5-epimerase-like enzyme
VQAPALLPTTEMKGVSIVKFTTASDLRGDLLAVELEKHIPFPVRRMFYVMNVPSYHVRGEHAHHECHQLLVCLQGSVTLTAHCSPLTRHFFSHLIASLALGRS